MEKRRWHLAAIIVLIVGTWVLTVQATPEVLTVLPAETATMDYATIPYSINGWTGRDVQIEDNAFTILNRDADFWMVREYHKGHDRMVLSLVSTLDQRKLFRIHIPDICLPAQGWTIADHSTHRLNLEHHDPFLITKLLANKGTTKSQVLYWFTSSDRVAESKIWHRLLLVWDGITGERTPGTLIQVTAPITDKDRNTTLKLQEEFLEIMYPYFSDSHSLG